MTSAESRIQFNVFGDNETVTVDHRADHGLSLIAIAADGTHVCLAGDPVQVRLLARRILAAAYAAEEEVTAPGRVTSVTAATAATAARARLREDAGRVHTLVTGDTA